MWKQLEGRTFILYNTLKCPKKLEYVFIISCEAIELDYCWVYKNNSGIYSFNISHIKTGQESGSNLSAEAKICSLDKINILHFRPPVSFHLVCGSPKLHFSCL